MITLREAMEKSGLSMGQIGNLIGYSKAVISQVAAHKYPKWWDIERRIIETMVARDYLKKEEAELEVLTAPKGVFHVDPNKFITTENTMALDELAQDLLNPATTLNASIGIVCGHAGYGKTTAIKHFCTMIDAAVYVLFIEGFTLTTLVREIAKALGGVRYHSFELNKDYIKEATSVYRKLIVIDEADRLPLRYLESIRNLNEYCGLPFLLVGESSIKSKMAALPRLESRIRNRPLEFSSLSDIDIRNFYQQAVGLDIAYTPKAIDQLLKLCHGDFRIMVNDAHRIVQILNANGLDEISQEVIDAIK